MFLLAKYDWENERQQLKLAKSKDVILHRIF